MYLLGDLLERGTTEIAHRIQCVWFKFGKYARVLTNKSISVKLRLKLFDAAISPTILFGLCTLPVHETCLKKIDVVQSEKFLDGCDMIQKVGRSQCTG